MPGRLVVEVIESDGIDHNLGITLPHDIHKTKFATVVRTSDAETFPVGCTIMYDRMHGSEIEMLSPDGVPMEFTVVMTADVSLAFY